MDCLQLVDASLLKIIGRFNLLDAVDRLVTCFFFLVTTSAADKGDTFWCYDINVKAGVVGDMRSAY